MTILDCIDKLLCDIGKPMHIYNIAKELIERGLWNTTGKTPETSVKARLYVDIKKNGRSSRFVQTAPGTFALVLLRYATDSTRHRRIRLLMGYPFNRTYCMLSRWATRALACTIRDPWVNSRRGSGPMRTAWTTWSGYDGLMASLVRLAVAMVAGDWVMGVSSALSAAAAPR